MPQRIGPVERVELELPGTASHELVVYHITDGSPVAKGHRLPRWARPSLVVRDGRSFSVHLAGRLQPDDYVYIFTSAVFIPLLDRLFASRSALGEADHAFYGDLAIEPKASLAALAESYGIAVPGEGDATVGSFLLHQFDGRVEVGDRLVLGPVDLIVRAVDEHGAVSEVGLSLQRITDEERPAPGRMARIVARLRRLVGALPPSAELRDTVVNARQHLPGRVPDDA